MRASKLLISAAILAFSFSAGASQPSRSTASKSGSTETAKCDHQSKKLSMWSKTTPAAAVNNKQGASKQAQGKT